MDNQVASLCVQGPKGGSSVRSSVSAAVCLAADLGIKRFAPIYLRCIWKHNFTYTHTYIHTYLQTQSCDSEVDVEEGVDLALYCSLSQLSLSPTELRVCMYKNFIVVAPHYMYVCMYVCSYWIYFQPLLQRRYWVASGRVRPTCQRWMLSTVTSTARKSRCRACSPSSILSNWTHRDLLAARRSDLDHIMRKYYT